MEAQIGPPFQTIGLEQLFPFPVWSVTEGLAKVSDADCKQGSEIVDSLKMILHIPSAFKPLKEDVKLTPLPPKVDENIPLLEEELKPLGFEPEGMFEALGGFKQDVEDTRLNSQTPG